MQVVRNGERPLAKRSGLVTDGPDSLSTLLESHAEKINMIAARLGGNYQ